MKKKPKRKAIREVAVREGLHVSIVVNGEPLRHHWFSNEQTAEIFCRMFNPRHAK